jgi:peptide/nickel transport system substrate-binding protein
VLSAGRWANWNGPTVSQSIVPERSLAMGTEPAIARIGRTADLDTLNPIMVTELNDAGIVTQLFDHLLEVDGEFNYVAREIVNNWSIGPDGDIVDFHLRPGVRFHDGTELTANDVAFTFQAVLDPANRSPLRSQLIFAGQELGFEAIDKYRLRFWLPGASASCLESIARMPLLPKRLYDGEPMPGHQLSNSPVGGGAFRFGEWKRDKYLSIQAFNGYYPRPPNLDRVDFVVFDSIDAAIKALLAGDIDYVPDAGAEIARSLPRHRGTAVRWSQAPTVTYLAFNLDVPPVRDQRVRSAIAHAIDRQGLVHAVMAGGAVVADTVVPPNTFWRNEDLIAHDYNIARACALLDAAGWRVADSSGRRRNAARVPMEMPIVTSAGDRCQEHAAEFIAADLRRIGIDSHVCTFDPDTLMNRYIGTRDYTAAVMTVRPGSDPSFLNAFYHSSMVAPAGPNRCAYRNPRVDQLLEDSLSLTRDRSHRKALLDEVQRIVAVDLPHVTLYNPRFASVCGSRIQVPADAPFHGDDLATLRRWRLAR